MTNDSFASKLRLARGRSGLTVDQLATLAGLSPTGITNLEMGRVARPRIGTVVALAAALGIEPEELIGEPQEVAS